MNKTMNRMMTLKRMMAFLFAFTVLLCTLITAPMASLAESNPSGGTSKTTTLNVTASKAFATITLSSSVGTVDVFHRSLIRETVIRREKHHGFYQVEYRKSGSKSRTSFIWAPSATTNKRGINTNKNVTIILPAKGTYTVRIRPLGWKEAAKYWYLDTIKAWISPAKWTLTKASGCKASVSIVEDVAQQGF